MDLWKKLIENDEKLDNDSVILKSDEHAAPSTPNLTDESDIDLVDLTNVSNNDGFDIEEDDCDLNQSLLQISRKPKVTRMRSLKSRVKVTKVNDNLNLKHDR